MLAAGLGLGLNHGWRRPRLNWRTDLPLLAWLGWTALSATGTVNAEATRFEVLRLAVLALVYFLVAYGLEPQREQRLFAAALVALAFADALFGLAEFSLGRKLLDFAWLELPHSHFRVSGTFRNPNHFAGLMAMTVFLAFGLAAAVRHRDEARSEQIAQRLFLLLPGGLIALALLLSLSRGGWASFLAGTVFFLVLLWWHSHPLWSRALIVALVLAVLIAAVAIRTNRDPILRRLQTLETFYQPSEEITLGGRLSIWKSSAAMIRDHPWTGVGWGAFGSAFPCYRRPDMLHGVDFAHNDYLQIAVETGVPGLFFFLLFLAALFGNGLRVIRSRAADFWALAMPGILAGLFGLLVHELVDFNLLLPSNALVFFSLSALVSARGNETR